MRSSSLRVGRQRPNIPPVSVQVVCADGPDNGDSNILTHNTTNVGYERILHVNVAEQGIS